MARLSRRKIAGYAVDKLLGGSSKRSVTQQLAAYLVDSGRTREIELLVRDIEDLLAERGIVVAEVTSIRPLSTTLKADIKKLIGARDLQLREVADETVLGGVRIDLPGKRFDGTIHRKLAALKAKQV
jgi:F-type H+-transporting ATPase subunit delta